MRPGTRLHQRFIYSLASKDKEGMKAAAERVAGWDFGAFKDRVSLQSSK